jgi:acyl carrier protein
MSENPTDPATGDVMAVPTQREIEDVIIDLLAEDGGVNPADLRRQLEGQGAGLPIDSLLAVEVLVRVELRFGVQLDANPATAEAMQSVSAFATAVRNAVLDLPSEAAQ